jgi:glycosyltransferase involved in cell wall biosynthesis
MLVGVCDFPGSYAFPPAGYGGIERWLWAAAVGARRAGADVHLLGPSWRPDLGDEWVTEPVRLENLTPGSHQLARLRWAGYDLLVVGHEYPSLPAWRRAWEELDCDVVTFQHSSDFRHTSGAFDGCNSRLYCYSPEMTERYLADHPRAELAVHVGFGEEEAPAAEGCDLVWLGRIDGEKAPHLAIMAAALLGRRIWIIGPVFDEDYVSAHHELFRDDHVEFAGELHGAAKTAALNAGRVLVYSCARHYVEAGAAVFGESLRAGTPVAALAWRQGTCAQAALCGDTGAVATVPPEADDTQAASALAEAIEQAVSLKPAHVQEVGQARFDPVRHFQALASRHAEPSR